jgi:hypothetical protein
MMLPPPRRRRGLAQINASKVLCVRGHSFDTENTRWQVDSAGYLHRQCRQCRRDWCADSRNARAGSRSDRDCS